MKIERDKVYLTRCGEKVRVIYTDSPLRGYPIIGIDSDGSTFEYTDNGKFHHGEGNHSRLDLVSEYVEPPKPREVWVYEYGEVLGEAVFTSEPPKPENAIRAVKFREVIE